ncbi:MULTISPECIES: structural cement protein Gp24 [unclassified Pseudomonas]|uniref:structural cement protein Gp24 n=1 Tax=unclassified Pseudomonas TaxID=196821 RepID=UPI003B9EAE5A
MAAYQTTYSDRPAKGLHGASANEEIKNDISRTIENAAGVRFGEPVMRGAGDHGVIPFAVGGKFVGIAKLNPAVPAVAAGSTLVDGYPQYFTAAIRERGQMYVQVGAPVVDGDPVYYITATNKYTNAAGTGIVGPFANVFFDTTGAADDIVEISIKNRSA